uniref:Uncharacterized protein n=1 Tax=Denticeps clupeoides TaxID=299321 RepID=A0AAY4DF45_9TELE
MNSAEQTVTWLITLGVLESPKKTISDPEGFLQASLRDGSVLCRLLERLRPGSVDKIYQDPRTEGECLRNIREFLRGCAAFRLEVSGRFRSVGSEPRGVNLGLCLSRFLLSVFKTRGSCQDCCWFNCYHNYYCYCKGCRREIVELLIRDMSESGGQQIVVKARFNFQQTNEDELSFSKGDIIHVTRQEEGGWWEGSLSGKTGWFPSNYVREVKGSGERLCPPKAPDTAAVSKTYYNVVLQNILETETEYSKELQNLLSTYLRSLQTTENSADISHIQGNLEDISTFQQTLVQSLEECTRLPENQQRIGGFFLKVMAEMKSLYLAYCSNHPSAVRVLTEHGEELGQYMESRGAISPGILTLTTGLSKPFMRLDKYPTLLKELERHIEDHHPDRPDVQKSMTVFKNLSAHCQEVRKRKELELQILTETIRSWEGEDIRTLGSVLYMSQVSISSPGSEEKNERYLLLFPHVLLMLSASSRMSGFIYQGKLPLIGTSVTRLEDTESIKNAFEISGNMIERIQVVCNSQRDMQEWLEHLYRQTKHTTGAPCTKPQSVPCHTVFIFLFSSSHSPMWGPLEPPKTQKPWSLSCLRPAPPLRPSTALGYKDDISKSPKSMKKLLPKRKPERKPSDEEFAVRKSTAALEEDAQILKVIEAYCTSAKTRQTLNSSSRKESGPHMLFPEEEKIIVEETRSNGQMVVEERSLVDTVYALRDEVQELKQDNKRMKRALEEEQRARKELEKIVRRALKNDPSWDETNL